MNYGRGNQEEEEEEDEEFGSKRDAAASNNSTRDVKNGDKANAMRSKHSVTEQRRRSKINERFQILRDLIPHSDQKRDTASFLLEVIQYVQYLQENVKKYENSCQTWSSEPTKLIPWRNNPWRVQSIAGQPQPMKNSSEIGATISATFDENNNPAVPGSLQRACLPNTIGSIPICGASCLSMDPQTDSPYPGGMAVPDTTDGAFSHSISQPASKRQSTEYLRTAAPNLNGADELIIERGTISISSVYSQGLLNSLTRALESTGVDLSQANVSVQINLGKPANRGSKQDVVIPKDNDMPVHSGNRLIQDLNSSEDFGRLQKRVKL